MYKKHFYFNTSLAIKLKREVGQDDLVFSQRFYLEVSAEQYITQMILTTRLKHFQTII